MHRRMAAAVLVESLFCSLQSVGLWSRRSWGNPFLEGRRRLQSGMIIPAGISGLQPPDCKRVSSELDFSSLLENCSPSIMLHFNSKEVRQLLHNKFLVVIGDSIQRSVYKDLVQLLQSDSLLTSSQLKTKGEICFENDHLVEGGVLRQLHNETHYREVRQYCTQHHLVRFYFITRVYSEYLESILADFQAGPPPDVLILNSCVWDVSRYGPSSMQEYRKNLETVFNRLDAVLPVSCLVIWNMTMPLGPRITGGFLSGELPHLCQTLRNDIIEGNFYGATLAGFHLFDVLDLHYNFRRDLGNRVKDGIHWNNVVHRRITNLLLTHVADAWGVVIPGKKPQGGPVWEKPTVSLALLPACPPPRAAPAYRDQRGPLHPDGPDFHEDSFYVPSPRGPGQPIAGFISFEDSRFPSFHLDAVALNNIREFDIPPSQPHFSAYPLHNENLPPCSSRRSRRRAKHHCGLTMHRQPFGGREDVPYRRTRNVPYDHF
ncbi:PC-esterase domain-containing protein 1A isoform X2 [Hemicordylus capensis]|uniref:PC-esterase domain-containing protein 1A isoform X2 n=1 Tax=Hemicordylus capensis TaxID=884348 RepID=UPI0023027A95|nr:PC-esterase domain-containing protein 1A isoform X2 [Hemicordylus capensis]